MLPISLHVGSSTSCGPPRRGYVSLRPQAAPGARCKVAMQLLTGSAVSAPAFVSRRSRLWQRQHKKILALRASAEVLETIKQCFRENRTDIFQEIPDDTILSMLTRVVFEPGSQIFHPGCEVTALYVIESGELCVSKRLLPEDEHEFEATTLGAGSYIGELALFYNRACIESVRVKGDQPAVLWQLLRSDYQNLRKRLEDNSNEECPIDLDAPPEAPPSIFVVSDGSGYSGQGAATLALKQFEYKYRGSCQGVSLTTFSYIRYAGEVLEITRRAREENALVLYTLMRIEPRSQMHAEVQRELKDGERELRAVDLWEPMIANMETFFGISRRPEATVRSVRRDLSEECLRMVEAIEFTRKLDDGVYPELWKEADLVLIGVSRSGKTPLSYFLAQRGFKVANYPIVPDEEPPIELFHEDIQHKCFGLIIKPERLAKVRNERMNDFGRAKSTYASVPNCAKEVSWLKTFYMRRGPRWPVLDTTDGSVEEIAAKIIKILKSQRGADEAASAQFADPSVA